MKKTQVGDYRELFYLSSKEITAKDSIKGLRLYDSFDEVFTCGIKPDTFIRTLCLNGKQAYSGFLIQEQGCYKVTRFFASDFKTVEAEYFYYNGWCDYKRSWGFTPDSVGEFRKKKAHKTGKCFFSLETGWWGSWNGKEYVE